MDYAPKPAKGRILSRLILTLLGMVIVVPQTTTLIIVSTLLDVPELGYDNSIAMPVVSALVVLPTTLCVLLFNIRLSRDIESFEAELSLNFTAFFSLIVFFASIFVSPLDVLTLEDTFLIVVTVGFLQSLLVSPLQSFSYALTNTQKFSGGVLYIILGSLIIGCVQSLFSMLAGTSHIAITFGVACIVFVAAARALSIAIRMQEPPMVENIEIEMVDLERGPETVDDAGDAVYRPTTTKIEASEEPGALRITMGILRDGWPSFVAMMMLQAGSWAVYPTLCAGIRATSMNATLFDTLITFVVPNGGALLGTLLALYNFNLGRWVEMDIGAIRLLGMLVLTAACNYHPYARLWSWVLLSNDYVCLTLYTMLFIVGGATLIEVYRTLALSVEARYAPRAATLGSAFCILGNMIGLVISVIFPHVI